MIGKFTFVADNESHTESDFSSEVVGENCTDTDDDIADPETDEEDVDVDSTASAASNYKKNSASELVRKRSICKQGWALGQSMECNKLFL